MGPVKKRILIIEDDKAIREGLCDALASANYEVKAAGDAREGNELAQKLDCELVLLDVMLPKGDGFEILRAIRKTRPTLPVIMLTARGSERDRVTGLKDGADDYVVKPFSLNELLARVEAVLRRSAARPSDIENILLPNGTIVDFSRREVRSNCGDRTGMSDREMELIRYLAINRGRAVPREELLANVWRIGPRAAVSTRTIDMTIVRLRQKLSDDAESPAIILTVRGKGYMLNASGDTEEGN